MRDKVIQTKNSQETFEQGIAMAKSFKGGEVIALHGDLGSGKTTFAQGIAFGLGLRQRITSPTFLLIKHYPLIDNVITDFYHADLYRVENSKDINEIGLSEMAANPHAVTVIEWPEKMGELLPKKTIHLTFFYEGENNRLIAQGTVEVFIKKAVKVLKAGGIVIFPTDTAFGMGCKVNNEESVKKLFAIRERPLSKAVPVLFNSINQVSNYVQDIPKQVRQELMEKYWPGALTIILHAQIKKVANLVLAGTTIGVRVPSNDIVREIISQVGSPIVGTSANFHKKPTPYLFSDLDPKLCELVDYVVPGVCLVKKESTVIDATISPYSILRHGAIEL